MAEKRGRGRVAADGAVELEKVSATLPAAMCKRIREAGEGNFSAGLRKLLSDPQPAVKGAKRTRPAPAVKDIDERFDDHCKATGQRYSIQEAVRWKKENA